jgi:hypothetical protein
MRSTCRNSPSLFVRNLPILAPTVIDRTGVGAENQDKRGLPSQLSGRSETQMTDTIQISLGLVTTVTVAVKRRPLTGQTVQQYPDIKYIDTI